MILTPEMLKNQPPVIQALLGTLMTWGITALGASVAVFVQGNQVIHLKKKSFSCFCSLKLN
jgi:hypothetical protein